MMQLMEKLLNLWKDRIEKELIKKLKECHPNKDGEIKSKIYQKIFY